MTTKKDRIAIALDRIKEGLRNINTDADWQQYLQFQSRFYSYSARNAMLIYAQNPRATYVKGYRAWNSLGRYVKRGAKGIAILAPCHRRKKDEEDVPPDNGKISGFRIVYVYDVSDTAGSDEQLPVLVTGLRGDGAEEERLYEKLKSIVSTRYTVEEAEGMAAKGSYTKDTGVIAIKADQSHGQKVKTLLHEYAHGIDFAMYPGKSSREIREVVAEGAAYVVAQHLGLDTAAYSMGYIKTWLGDTDRLAAAASGIQHVSERIITDIEEHDKATATAASA